MSNTELDNSAISRHLGQSSEYVSTYNPNLLVREPRSNNRKHLGIEEDQQPFYGFDVWNGYEVSALHYQGLPVSFIAKIIYSSDSKYIVESKSMKLYWNSFNMEKMGNTKEAIKQNIITTARRDLSQLLETDVVVNLFDCEEYYNSTNNVDNRIKYTNIDDVVSISNIYSYQENSSLLQEDTIKKSPFIAVKSSLLKSNCRVTSQPDWGDVFIYIKGDILPTYNSLIRYIVSFRDECHFHEEICETIYMRLKTIFEPTELSVKCLYVRRGGWDINPQRCSHEHLFDTAMFDPSIPWCKTARQ